ncbi:MAG: hypothetical protein WCQ48_04360 [Chloroflexota bacterium]
MSIEIVAICNPGPSTASAFAGAGAAGIQATSGASLFATVLDWNATLLSLDFGAFLTKSQFDAAFVRLPGGLHSVTIREARVSGTVTSAPLGFSVVVPNPFAAQCAEYQSQYAALPANTAATFKKFVEDQIVKYCR